MKRIKLFLTEEQLRYLTIMCEDVADDFNFRCLEGEKVKPFRQLYDNVWKLWYDVIDKESK